MTMSDLANGAFFTAAIYFLIIITEVVIAVSLIFSYLAVFC